MGLMSISDNKNDQDLSVDDATQQVNAKDSTTQKIVDGIDSLFAGRDTSVAESACHGAYTAKESSTGHNNGAQPAYSNAASADSLRSCKTEPNPCYGKQYSNISFSNLTGESTAGDYQDCGASSMLLTGEPPWSTPAHDSTTPSGIRSDAVLRYKEKKKNRKWLESILR
nr:hypothetical protein [Tanacetum cinerariifolium]